MADLSSDELYNTFFCLGLFDVPHRRQNSSLLFFCYSHCYSLLLIAILIAILFQICSRTSQYTWYSLIRPRTGGLSSSCEMIILRSKSHGEIIRVCRGIFTTALRKKNIVKFSIKQPHLTSTAHRLLSDRLLCWKEPFEPFYFFLDHFCAGPQRFLFFRHANAKLPPQHWTLIVVENIAFTILHFWVMRET